MDTSQESIANAARDPKNLGELPDADAIGTAGSPDCGDMLRMWIKFTEKDGRKVIDKATFQSFGCETAIAVASLATEMLVGKTPDEALQFSGQDLAAPLGPLPPMKIHCSQMVETALKQALAGGTSGTGPAPAPSGTPTLLDQLAAGSQPPKKINLIQ